MTGRKNRAWRVGLLVVGVSWVTAASAAAAEPAPAVDATIEESRDAPRRVALYVPVVVTVTDHQTGGPPAEDFNVYALASNAGGETTETYPCGHRTDNNPGVARGVYDCTVIVDHGGAWTFTGVVNRIPRGRDLPMTVARSSTDITVEGGALAGTAPKAVEVRGRLAEVVVLWTHSAFALAWFAVIGVLVMLAVPALRRQLSSPGVHRLEDHLDGAVRGLWALTALVVGTGVYLMLEQTAYKTPWSLSAVRAVSQLPYGRPYFLALATKLVAYALMVLTTVALSREARQRSLLREGGGAATRSSRRFQPRPPWNTPPRSSAGRERAGGVATVVRPERTAAGTGNGSGPDAPADRSPVRIRVATATVLIGGVTIWVCVTGLKYFHELVEASRSLLLTP
jgi:hypothetical protein